MPITTVVKSKGTRTCANCGSNLAADAGMCQNCGSKNIKKSLVVVRKSESTADVPGQEPPDIPVEGDVQNPTEAELDLEADDEPTHDDIASDEVDDDDYEMEEEELQDEDSEDDDEEEPPVKKSLRIKKSSVLSKSTAIREELALMALTGAVNIMKCADDEDFISKLDSELTVLNNAVDSAIESWSEGEPVSKAVTAERKQQIQARLKVLRGQMADIMGSKDPDGDGDDDTSPETDTDHDTFDKDGKPVKKNDGGNGTEDIYKGMHPEVVKRLQEADAIVEQNKVSKFEDIAKSLGQIGDSAVSVGATLRFLSENNPEGFEVMKSQLAAANEANKQSSIFKSYGSPQPGATGSQAEVIAKGLMDRDTKLTKEQALAKAYAENPALYDEAVAK